MMDWRHDMGAGKFSGVLVSLPTGRMIWVDSSLQLVSVADVVRSLESRFEEVNGQDLIVSNGARIAEDEETCPARLWLSVRLCGGKGGFGALLRNATPGLGAANKIDNGAMRDLQGRRIRDVRRGEPDEKVTENKRKTESEDKKIETVVERVADTKLDSWRKDSADCARDLASALEVGLKKRKAVDSGKKRKTKRRALADDVLTSGLMFLEDTGRSKKDDSVLPSTDIVRRQKEIVPEGIARGSS